jgi:hypothetical protein
LDTGGEGIFTGSGGPTTTIVDDSGPLNRFFRVSLNDSGTVAFFASPDTGGQGIFTGSGGPTTTIADDSGPFNSFGDVSLNNSGTVAFEAVLDTGGRGIFTGPDPLADEVIGRGDTLFGSIVTSFGIGPEALNDTGQIAFNYALADGRIGIARADPLVALEPGTLPLLLLTGLLGAVLWHRDKSSAGRNRLRHGSR